jgi:hypothetical protein
LLLLRRSHALRMQRVDKGDETMTTTTKLLALLLRLSRRRTSLA